MSPAKPTQRNPQLDSALIEKAQVEVSIAQLEYILAGNRIRPCHSYPVRISHDGMRWACESIGAEGTIGYGDSPGKAMSAFDVMWIGE